jgi:hypothetical protein
MENNKSQQINKLTFSLIFEQITGKSLNFPFKNNPVKLTTEFSCYILDEENPYYKYFLAKENEKKENLVLIYQSIMHRRLAVASGLFLTYNIAKSLLWRRGYFAYFFYHTRMVSVILYLMTISLINNRFEADLTSNDLIRYYDKRNANKIMEAYVKKEIAKKQILTGRDDVSLI